MDILVPLLFMALFYLGPPLLKRYREQIKAQLPVPEVKSELMNEPEKVRKVPAYRADDTELHAGMVADHKQSVPTIVQEQSAWSGKLDQNMIINGVIFAEILQPPRAYRPFTKHTK